MLFTDPRLIESAMAFNPDWSIDPMIPTTLTDNDGQHTDFLTNFEMPDWDQFNFESLAPSKREDGHPFLLFSPLQSPAHFHSTPLSPLGIPGSSPTPSIRFSPTPDPSSAGPSSGPPTTPPPPPTPPALNQIVHFDLCPYTRHGQICKYVSWASSPNKQIKRHMKAEHFPDTSLGYNCPNPKCTRGNYRFLRRDTYIQHRRACDLAQAPGYILLPNIVSGSDAEVNRWMKARCKQRREIIKKMREGTPWSIDLLEPVSL
ncbi:hypothetical protein BDM02DRAFT_343431 [Thelephora ganbajun]|uniref:Uncharacterized protein n=1 Tax=Thelephora ganbajun TaxID=370292 RepID=A0ACB6ZRB8_THEGA|nr:hypothetical protein BDM02DRAFT_343431 [Thelephora ganbajun]